MTEVPQNIREAYGILPPAWRLEKLKFFSGVRNSNVDKTISQDESPVKLCNYVDVYYNDRITRDIDFMNGSATKAEVEKFQLKRSQVILTKDSESWDDIGIPALVMEDMPDVVCGYHLSVLEADQELDGTYLSWLCRSDPLNDQFKTGANGVTRYGLGQYPMKNAFIALPPLDTQRRIAAFLDEKTARIDGLIAKKRVLLERLAEKRQALITHAVTKGLDPNAPMKPSGIDWLGEIPAHWEVRRLKEIGRLIGGAGFPHECQGHQDFEFPFFKVGDLGRVGMTEPLLRAENTVDSEITGYLRAEIIEKSDVVFAKVGAALLLNRFRRVGCRCCIDNNMMALRPNQSLDTDFALFAMSLIDFSDIVNKGAVPSVNGNQVGRIAFALPPVNEQKEIAASLRRSLLEHDRHKTKVTESIALLTEYRSALITAAVTGQITGLQ